MKTTKQKRQAANSGRTTRARVAAAPARVLDAQRAAPAALAIALPGNCSVKDAAALKQTLCGLEPRSATVTIDVAALERIDTATMQLLCAFVRECAARNQKVEWSGTSQAFDEAVRLLGVRALLCSNQPADAKSTDAREAAA